MHAYLIVLLACIVLGQTVSGFVNFRARLIGVVAEVYSTVDQTWPTGEKKLGMVSACIGLSSFCPELGCGAAII